ncbi:unnamed protein product, partial [Polarella glacialis]
NSAGESCLMTSEHLDELASYDDKMLQIMGDEQTRIDETTAIRVLSESVARTATVLRCAADKAITTATAALELSCSLATLARERTSERAQAAEKQQSEDSPRISQMNSDGAFRGKTGAGGSSADGCSDDEGSDTQSGRGAERGGEEAKSKQALLHVRNLRYFGSLNQEVLELQDKLRDSMRPD